MKEEINYPMELIISDKLKKLLEDSNSKVAKQILELKSLENCKEWINYLDVAKDDATKISYLNKSRYAALISKKLIKFEDLKEGDEFICINSEEVHGVETFGLDSQYGQKFVVVSTPEETLAGIVLKAKNVYNGTWNFRKWDIDGAIISMWHKDMRYMASCGKLVQKLLGPQDGKELAKFCELFGAYHPDFRFNVDYDVDFVKGEDIRYWYHEDNYFDNSNSLGNSCMRYNSCQKYFDLYTTNDIVSMFIVKDKSTSKLVGRCLLWDNKYFDRIYANSTTLSEKIKVYLERMSFIDVYDGEMNITLPLVNGTNTITRFPYCDTFKYIGKDFISTNEDEDYEYCLQSTDGYWNDHDEGIVCSISGDALDEDDAIYIEGTGYVHRDYTAYSRWDDEYYLSDDVTYCECLDDYISNGDVTRLYNDEYTHDYRTVELHDGRFADEKDDDLVELENGDYALIEECKYSNLNSSYILSSEACFCDVQKDWVYEYQLIVKNEEEEIES